MSQRSNDPITCIAGENIEAFRRVKISAAGKTVSYADAADLQIYDGTSETFAAAGTAVAVKLAGINGSHKCVADRAIAALAAIYSADDGKVSTVAAGRSIGKALEAAGADGDVIECLLYPAAAAAITGDEVIRAAIVCTNITKAGTNVAPEAVTLPMLFGGLITQSYAGASFIELATPDAGDAGLCVKIIKLGSTGAITITTAGAEKIAAGDSLATLDAKDDQATLYWNGTGWVIIESAIA